MVNIKWKRYIYDLIEEYGFNTDEVCTAVKEKFYITDKDWRNIIEMYKNDSDID